MSVWAITIPPGAYSSYLTPSPLALFFCSHLSAVFGLYFLTTQLWMDSDAHPQYTAALLGADMRPNVASYLIDTLLVEE